VESTTTRVFSSDVKSESRKKIVRGRSFPKRAYPEYAVPY
jgi:hypothetical protein